jgi:chitodextrinase
VGLLLVPIASSSAIENQAPTADHSGPYEALVGETIAFNGLGSFDLDGTIVAYYWDFGNGGVGFGPAPLFDYAAPGTFTVSLTVTDDMGATDTATTTATIAEVPNQPPVADPSGPYGAFVAESITFDGSASFDPDGTIVSYQWDFGDGATGTGATSTHAYATAGVYDVTLTVTDDGDATDTATTTATIGATIDVGSESFEAVETTIDDMGLARGTENSLLKKIQNAQQSLDEDNGGVCGKLGSLINQVNALEGKKLEPDQAIILRSQVQAIGDAIGCGG